MPDYSTEENEGRAAKKEQPGGPSNTAVKIVLAAAGLAGIMLLGRATLTTERMSSGSHQKTNDERLIYHLVVDGEFQQAIENGVYRPDSLSADGFVHCAFKDSVVPVANDYFSQVSAAVLVLAINPNLLSAETRYEEAKPVEGEGTDQPTTSDVFPHIYGPIDCNAVTGVGRLVLGSNGFQWPTHFEPVSDFLSVSEPWQPNIRSATPEIP